MKATEYPADQVVWRDVESSNVSRVGWLPHDAALGVFVEYASGTTYLYLGATRQRAVAAVRAASVGRYINNVLKPKFPAVRV